MSRWRLVGRYGRPFGVQRGDLLRFSPYESGVPFRVGCARVSQDGVSPIAPLSACDDDYVFAWTPTAAGDGVTDRLARIEAELGLDPWEDV